MGDDAPQPKKKTPSDQLRQASVQEYIAAHAKPNGQGWKGFFHSNLFTALLLWCLSQGVVFGGFIISYYIRTSQLAEWKGQTDATLKRMDEDGTMHTKYVSEQQSKELAEIDIRLKRVEEDTRHIEVLESEHRRLTKDVEELRNEKK